MKTLGLVLILLTGFYALADNSSNINMAQDFDSLGNNEAVINQAKNLDSSTRYKIVQSRAVDLNSRLEMGVGYGFVSGGDAYFSTQDFQASMDFHITPHWSLGVRYLHAYNSLTSEGQNAYTAAETSGNGYFIPGSDYPVDTYLGVVDWYPVYGKVNLFNKVYHFDIYTLAGAGETVLTSGTTAIYTLGGGFAFWLNNWLSLRLEGRWQTYTATPNFDGAPVSQQTNQVVGLGSIGILL